MSRRILSVLTFLLQYLAITQAYPLSHTYDLPSLHISSTQDYLIKGVPTILRCNVIDGWRYNELADVEWQRDGLRLEVDGNDYVIGSDNTLNITSAKQVNEGEFQCQGWIREVALKNAQRVDANLISPPLKLRRARITKFEKVKEVVIYARPGSVARLPCPGMPDVVPGPPEITFERESLNETVGSTAGHSRFLSSTAGMQIAMVQPSDAGRYYCLVRNEFTKQERRASTAVELKVVTNSDPENALMPSERMEVSYPAGTMSSLERPIPLEVVYMNNILIECVIKNAKISWTKHNKTLKITTSDKDTRFRQVFGNLQIRDLQSSDAGIYVCKGQSHFNDNDEVSVYYELIVHQPSDVELHLTQTEPEKPRYWEISCFAQNLRYEIPMVFVNATPLIDVVETRSMGIPTKTNFYTNPINVTMMSRRNFTGSVQCISRPAMEEAEIYGMGLERGRSRNYYVLPDDERSSGAILRGPVNKTVIEGDTVELECYIKRGPIRQWKKDAQPVQIGSKGNHHLRYKILPSNSLEISNVQLSDEGWYTCLVEDSNRDRFNATAYLAVIAPTRPSPLSLNDRLKPKKKTPPVHITKVHGMVVGTDVRLQWAVEDSEAVPKIDTFVLQHRKEGDLNWVEGMRAAGHTRSASLLNFIPKTKYKFRVTALNDDNTPSAGTESDWIETKEPIREYKPDPPTIVKTEPLSSQSIRITWDHIPKNNHSTAAQFLLYYGKEEKADTTTQKIAGSERSFIVTGLQENATYSFSLAAENLAGASDRSNHIFAKTMHPDEERRGLLTLLQKGIMNMLPEGENKEIHFIVLLSIVPIILLLVCCACCCRMRGKKQTRGGVSGTGKFLDTSYNIYNQQKVHRNKLTEPYDPKEFFDNENIDEHLPLRGNNNEDRVSLNSRSSRRFRMPGGRFPNVYGRGEEESEDEHQEEDHLAPLENHYGGILSSYNAASTARHYIPETGMSREVLVPPPPPLLSNGGIPLYHPTSHTPLPPIPPLISTCSPLKSVSYKSSTDPAVLAYSPASLADSGGSGSGQTRTTNADSPTHPLTDGSDNGGHRNDSSRNSQISSVDGRFQPLASFKSNSTVTPLMSTFAR